MVLLLKKKILEQEKINIQVNVIAIVNQGVANVTAMIVHSGRTNKL